MDSEDIPEHVPSVEPINLSDSQAFFESISEFRVDQVDRLRSEIVEVIEDGAHRTVVRVRNFDEARMTIREHIIVTGSVFSLKKLRTGNTLPSAFWIDLLMPPKLALDAYANLEEVHPIWERRHGPRLAKWIFRFQMGVIVVGYRGSQLLGLVDRVVKAVRTSA